jgi:hypothetical protein
MDAFEKEAILRFEDKMVAHLGEFFAEQCRELGEPRLRAVIRLGIARAASHDITSERDVCKYLNMMFAWGHDFDTDPSFEWARRILDDPTLTASSDKIALLRRVAAERRQP